MPSRGFDFRTLLIGLAVLLPHATAGAADPTTPPAGAAAAPPAPTAPPHRLPRPPPRPASRRSPSRAPRATTCARSRAHPFPFRQQVHQRHRGQAAGHRSAESTGSADRDSLRPPLGRQPVGRRGERKIGRRCVRSGGPRGRPPTEHARRYPPPPADLFGDDGVAHFQWVFARNRNLCGEGSVRRVEAPLAQALPRLFVQGRIKEALLRAARDARAGSGDAIGDLRAGLARAAAVGSGDGRPRGGGAAPLRRQADAREVAGPDQAGARPQGDRRDRQRRAGRVRHQRRRRARPGRILRAGRRREGVARRRAGRA